MGQKTSTRQYNDMTDPKAGQALEAIFFNVLFKINNLRIFA